MKWFFMSKMLIDDTDHPFGLRFAFGPLALAKNIGSPVYQRPLQSVDHCRVNPKAGSQFEDIISVPALYD